MKKLSSKAQEAGITIERHVDGYAYFRNGNAGNPTERVSWIVVNREGNPIGRVYKYAHALELADEYAADPR